MVDSMDLPVYIKDTKKELQNIFDNLKDGDLVNKLKAIKDLDVLLQKDQSCSQEIFDNIITIIKEQKLSLSSTVMGAFDVLKKTIPTQELLEKMIVLLQDDQYCIRTLAQHTLKEIIDIDPSITQEIFDKVNALFNHQSSQVKHSAMNVIYAISKNSNFSKVAYEAIDYLIVDDDPFIELIAMQMLGNIKRAESIDCEED